MKTDSLSKLLSIFAAGTRDERISISRLDSKSKIYFADAFEASSRLVEVNGEIFKAYLTIAILVRFVWKLVPSKLIETSSPDFRQLALGSLRNKFGNTIQDTDSSLVDNLVVIFKRIRQYAKEGRVSSSLDFSLIKHQDLFESQDFRCNHCKYKFTDELYRYDAEDDGVAIEFDPNLPNEISLERLYRKPELDHILPLILGGDGESNWQILCKSCNLGKSDLVNHMFSYSSNEAYRFGMVSQLTTGKRFALIAEAILKQEHLDLKDETKFFRIFREAEQSGISIDNLYAKYC